MDEIDSLSLSAQGKVLRLLQEHTYRPLGSDKFKETNLRIVIATNRDLEELIRQKCFRADLFFRINVLHTRLPALRERHSDIVPLGRHFVEDACRSAGIPKKILSAAALRKLENHTWPGNVRELDNTIQRAVLCTRGQHITACDIDLETSAGVAEMDAEKFRSAKLHAIQRFEHDYVRQMLEKHQGNVTRAALEAGKDRRAFGRLAKKYGIASEAA
jgi:DNA-binding NtrC family response regulator